MRKDSPSWCWTHFDAISNTVWGGASSLFVLDDIGRLGMSLLVMTTHPIPVVVVASARAPTNMPVVVVMDVVRLRILLPCECDDCDDCDDGDDAGCGFVGEAAESAWVQNILDRG